MQLTKAKRRAFWILITLLGLAIVAIVALPVWFPLILGPVVESFGARYSKLERNGYDSFTFRDFSFTSGPVNFKAQEVETKHPARWLHQTILSSSDSAPLVKASRWSLSVETNNTPEDPQPSTPSSTYTNIQKALSAARSIRRWMPNAMLTNGSIEIAGTEIPISSLVLSNGQLHSNLEVPGVKQAAELRLEFTDPGGALLNVNSDDLALQGQFELQQSPNEVTMDGKITWQTNRILVESTFDRQGTLPETARLQADELRVNPSEFGLKQYEEFVGSAHGVWSNASFSVSAHARAEPAPGQTNVPPLQVQLEATGNTNSAHVKQLEVTSPWININFPGPVNLDFGEQGLLRDPAKMEFGADLQRQPFLPMSGGVVGEVVLQPSKSRIPRAVFQLKGTNLNLATPTNLPPFEIGAAGSLEWPVLNLHDLIIGFADGSSATAEGSVDVQAKEIIAGELRISGGNDPSWLPEGYAYDKLQVDATVAGSITNLKHSGKLVSSGLKIPRFHPLDLTAEWSGAWLNISNTSVRIAGPNAKLDIAGALDVSTKTNSFSLSEFTLSTEAPPRSYYLRQPTSMHFIPGSEWRVSFSPLEWISDKTRVYAEGDVQWPANGMVNLEVQGLTFAHFGRLVPSELHGASVENLKATATWTNGPVDFSLLLSATVQSNLLSGTSEQLSSEPVEGAAPRSALMERIFPLAVKAQLAGGPDGVVVSNFLVTSQSLRTANAEGKVPITINPSAEGIKLEPHAKSPMNFTASISPKTPLWALMTDYTGVRLTDPALNLELSGNWQEPRGQVQLQASQILLKPADAPRPKLSDLNLELRLNRSEANLTNLQVKVEGQPVTVSARLPLEGDFLSRLREPPGAIVEKLTGSLIIEEASLAPFSGIYTNLLAPQGSLSAHLRVNPGLKLEGTLAVQNARTRPISNLGPIRDIGFQLDFEGRDVLLKSARGFIGASPIQVQGAVDLTGTNWITGSLPPFALQVTGTNVPLSRSPEAIIRSDLNVTVIHTNNVAPLIYGTADLRDSIVLSDLGSLVSGGVTTPERRPPFFSIETMPLADFRLQVKVIGAEFMRARTPLFRGVASVNFDLSGTLREPIAVGQATVNEGLIRFPFASFRIQQGFVTLHSDTPYMPQLNVQAASTQFSYDLRMEVTGPASEPILQFTSNPPLSSEQILLMVSAGELPRDEMVLSNQQRAQTFAVFLGRDLLARLGYGDEAEQRLSVYSGEEITQEGTPTYRVEYKLADKWTLVGEYDRFNEFNVGVRWRVYSK